MKTDQQMIRWALEESPEPIIKNPYLRSAFRGGQLVQPGPGRPGYGGEDELGKSLNYLKKLKPYKEPVYQLSIHFPPGMKKKEVNIVRKATPENLKMMKKLRDKTYGEIDTFYGPNRMTTEEILKFRDKHHTLTSEQVAKKLEGKIGPRGDKITATGIKKAALKAGKKGQYGKTTSLGRNLEQLKEQAPKLPSGKKYLDEYNKATNKDEALKLFRTQVSRALGNLAKDREKVAAQRAAWAKTESGAKSIEKSLEKQSALRMQRYGIFNPGKKPEQRLFHALWRSSQQEGSRWKLMGKKPDKWTTELSKGAKFLDTKNNKIITLDGLKKYMDTTPDVGSYKTALKPFKEKAAIQKYLVNYKGKEYKLGNLLNERLFTRDDWKNFKTGTSEIVINHPERVKNNWWKGEVAYKDANKKLNDIETKFLTKMKRADNDQALQKVIKNQFTKDIKKLGPITSISPHGAFGTKPTHSAIIQSMVKPMYKKTGDKALSRTLNTLVKQLGCGNVRLASQGGGDVDCYARGLEKIKSGNIKTPGEKANFSKLVKTAGGLKGIARITGLGLAWEAAFAPVMAAWMMPGGESPARILNELAYGLPIVGETEKEELKRHMGETGFNVSELRNLSGDREYLQMQLNEEINRSANIGGKEGRKSYKQFQIEQQIKKLDEKVRPMVDYFYEGPAGQYFGEEKWGSGEEARVKGLESLEQSKADWIKKYQDLGLVAKPGWKKHFRTHRMGGGIMGLKK
jgi:hypothetical protein